MDLKKLLFLKAAGGGSLPGHFPEDMLQVGYMGSSGDWHKSSTNNQVATIKPLDTRLKSVTADSDHTVSAFWYKKDGTYVNKSTGQTKYASFDFSTYDYVIVIRRVGGANLDVKEAASAVTLGY